MPDILASLPLSAIRIFEAAARLKSFTRAADELGVSQAAVSWQVKALEQRLDQPLFTRLPREVALTPAGERLSRAASEAMSILRTAVSDLVDTEEGVLSITTVQSVGGHWLAPRLGGFQIAHPRIAVRLDASSRLVDLQREPFDLALRAGGGDWPGMEAHFLIPSAQTVLCTPDLLARLGGPATPADLLQAPRIGAPEFWSAWFDAAGVDAAGDHAPPRLSADAQALEVATALAGQGVALGSPIFFAQEIAQGRLVAPFDITASYGGGYWVVYPAERRRVRKIVAFRDWILAQAAADPLVARYGRS
ncbi:LysR substrate-binding domain-containing protein [Caulobacter sp. LjRoot300]|uniref:LysR substrate-binding domain-containing protein n=1 Tax=Caulobacter sp. LjRoot300 TaxID=3342321 RepID=UPI003ECFF8CA